MNTTEKRRAFLINAAYYFSIVGLILLILKYTLGWLTPFILGFIVALIMRPAAGLLHKSTKLSRSACGAIAVLILYASLCILLYFAGAKVFRLSVELIKEMPEFYNRSIGPAIKNLNSIISGLSELIGVDPVESQPAGGRLNAGVSGFIANLSSNLLGFAAGITKRLPSIALASVFTILSSFFISTEFDRMLAFVSDRLPPKWLERARDFRRFTKSALKNYLKAYLILMVITFIELSVGFYIIRVKNAVIVAALIAIGDALPVLGTGIMVMPWIFIEILKGNYYFAMALTILYIIVTVVRNIIEPRIVGDQLGQNPLITLLAIYLGYKIIGVAGMIIAPITVQILLSYYAEGKIGFHRTTLRSKSSPEP